MNKKRDLRNIRARDEMVVNHEGGRTGLASIGNRLTIVSRFEERRKGH